MKNRLDVLASWFPDRAHAAAMEFVETGEVFSAVKARRAVEALIKLLRDKGAKEGECVAMVMNRSPQSALWAYAILAGNMALTPLSPKPEKDLADKRITHSDAKAFIGPEDYPLENDRIARIDPDGDESMNAVAEGADPVFREIDPESSALILYTSGTVGRPKGVLLSHRALNATYGSLASRLPYFKQGGRFLSFLPWHTPHGLYINFIMPVYFGMTIIVDRAFDAFGAMRFYATLEKQKPTVCTLVPAMLKSIKDFHARAQQPPGSLKGICCASAPLTKELRDWCDGWGVNLHNCYGMTETASWVSIDVDGSSSEPGCVGRPHMDVIVADEQGRALPPGEVGEILVAGDQLMNGYYKDNDLTAQALRDGRMHTGDLGRFTPEGRLIIVGRIKEIINVAGLKVIPQNVEAAAVRIPGVAEAGAFPVPDEKRGEIVGLAVVPEKGSGLDEKAVIKELKNLLSDVEVPGLVFFTKSLPKNQGGKLLRNQLPGLRGL